MSLAALFVVGVLVTIVVGSAVALLIYAAVLDGRDARRQDELAELRRLTLVDPEAGQAA